VSNIIMNTQHVQQCNIPTHVAIKKKFCSPMLYEN
jgi:hypothetical protein